LKQLRILNSIIFWLTVILLWGLWLLAVRLWFLSWLSWVSHDLGWFRWTEEISSPLDAVTDIDEEVFSIFADSECTRPSD
jgi:hypothetical protein